MAKSWLPLEVGKFYRTRDRHKVRIYATDCGGTFPVHCAFHDDKGRWVSYSTREDGHNYAAGESSFDIIGPWIDKPVVDWAAMPAWANWVAMDENGRAWYWYVFHPIIDTEDEIWSDLAHEKEFFGLVPSKYAPSFSGDWKDSLVERPK